MVDHPPPVLPLPAGHLLTANRQYRSASGSPTRQRPTDDLLAQLTPSTALRALRNPSGSLKRCMDAATASEQSFALRAALAAKSIQDWLHELSQWPWPAGSPCAGFEAPAGGDEDADQPDDSEDSWMGSLPIADVARYDGRVDAIQREMDELDVDEIKSHVLHHHILPLSRPGTPVSDSHRSSGSSASYSLNKMDDLTAVITAVMLQALPTLAKLVRLLNTWRVRLVILKRVPAMMAHLSDAEVAIRSGWNAVEDHPAGPGDGSGSSGSTSALTRDEFQIMKHVIEKKIAKAAHVMDFMLNTLDGREETIPDEWIDRMDRVEDEYSTWVAICERKIREEEWRTLMGEKPRLSPLPKHTDPEPDLAPRSPALEFGDEGVEATDVADSEIKVPPPETTETIGTQANGHVNSREEKVAGHSIPSLVVNVHPAAGEEDGSPRGTDIPALDSEDDRIVTKSQSVFPVENHDLDSSAALQESLIHDADEGHVRSTSPSDDQRPAEEEEEADNRGSVGRHPLSARSSVASLRSQPSLPSLRSVEHGGSEVSTIVYETPSGLDMSSDLPEYEGTPDLPRTRHLEMDPIPSDDLSPPSSPPNFRSSTRSTVTFNDMPTVTEVPDFESPPKTPLDASFADDTDAQIPPREVASPSRMSVTSEDDQLQQQISEILVGIPAKIHLSSQPSPINHLNPPEFQAPARPKSRQVDTVRSHSSLSSRAGTPSFLLAPAYARNPRPRAQRGNQEIKLYHLSRSTGEAPIKLFIRLVGENGERVMVRVGGGWADLGEYLKEYAIHHGRRSKNGGESKIEVRDLPPISTAAASSSAAAAAASAKMGSSPPSRPASALDSSPMTPLNVRKTRKSVGEDSAAAARNPKTPLAAAATARSSDTPSSGTSTRSRSSSRLSWTEEDSSLGMSGPKTKNVEMSDESRAWVESVKEKVRLASGERKPSDSSAATDSRFGEIGKVGGTKRLFRKG